MRVLRPHRNVLGFYDGRVAGRPRRFAEENWFDDGALDLGTCSYAIVDGDEALVYDTHISLTNAGIVRRTLEAAGVRKMMVALSHWHADHVAGTAVFHDCEIVANGLTRDLLSTHRRELEEGVPPIAPLFMPTRVFEKEMSLGIGSLDVVLRHADIHSADGTVLLLPAERLMLAGDTLEDPITYVVEPDRLATHLDNLLQMVDWPIDRILPNHGAPEVIARGGYAPSLVAATIRYVQRLQTEGPEAHRGLQDFMAEDFAKGSIIYEPVYERVHARNVRAIKSVSEIAPVL